MSTFDPLTDPGDDLPRAVDRLLPEFRDDLGAASGRLRAESTGWAWTLWDLISDASQGWIDGDEVDARLAGLGHTDRRLLIAGASRVRNAWAAAGEVGLAAVFGAVAARAGTLDAEESETVRRWTSPGAAVLEPLSAAEAARDRDGLPWLGGDDEAA